MILDDELEDKKDFWQFEIYFSLFYLILEFFFLPVKRKHFFFKSLLGPHIMKLHVQIKIRYMYVMKSTFRKTFRSVYILR